MNDHIPIQIVLYKSQSKIPNLIKSINLLEFPLDSIKVYFINNFPDDSLEKIVRSEPHFDYAYIENPQGNTGFGSSHNFLFKEYIKSLNSKYFLISNPDVIFFPSMLEKLLKDGEQNEDAMIIEPSQFPVEHSQVFDPQTHEKYWSTAACILIRCEYFKEIDGFDENIFMYCEDLDLSFRATIAGFKCIYSPTARLIHITQHFDPNKDLFTEYYYSRLGTLYILKKYFKEDDVKKYITQNIEKLEISLQKRILNDFNNIQNYDLSVRKHLPNSHIRLFDDFTFSPKRWEI